jgi:hypothetical protein
MIERGIISDVLAVRYLEFIIHELMDETVVRDFDIIQPELRNSITSLYFTTSILYSTSKRKSKMVEYF